MPNEKLFKAHKIRLEFNEKQNEFHVEDEMKKLEHQFKSEIIKLEKNLEKNLENNLKKLEMKLDHKLEEILKILKPE